MAASTRHPQHSIMSANAHPLYAFSRFFFASSAAEMQSACAMLKDAPVVADWDNVEFCFNRLFVGPAILGAPPYASVYLDGANQQVMGQTTTRIRELYQMIGLESPWLNKIPDDHLALELDALWQLNHAYQGVPDEQLKQVHDYLREHLLCWVPRFVERIRSANDVHPALLFMADRLLETLHAESARTAAPGIA